MVENQNRIPAEFKTVVKVLKSTYTSPNFLPDADAVTAWYFMLRDIEIQVLQAAVYKYAMQNKFPPTVADLRELAMEITQGEIADWGTGWEQVSRVIRKYGSYNQGAALAELDPVTRRAVERLGYMELCRSENPMADRANFRDIYNQLAKREKDNMRLPAKLLDRIAMLGGRSENLIE